MRLLVRHLQGAGGEFWMAGAKLQTAAPTACILLVVAGRHASHHVGHDPHRPYVSPEVTRDTPRFSRTRVLVRSARSSRMHNRGLRQPASRSSVAVRSTSVWHAPARW